MFIKSTVELTVDTAAYAAKDCVGGLLTFVISSGSQGATGAIIKRMTITDAAIQDEPMDLHLFTASPAAAARTDQAECVQVAADLLLKIVTLHIAAADFKTFAGDSIASYELDTAIVFDGLNIYGVLEAEDTPDYVDAADLVIHLIVEV